MDGKLYYDGADVNCSELASFGGKKELGTNFLIHCFFLLVCWVHLFNYAS